MDFKNVNATLDLNLTNVQNRLRNDVGRLSSGLRIQSAADDPSGLAIAEKLQAQVNGHDQATSNTQTAINAITVADGALQTVTKLLQRLRSLYVKANDDLLSDGDRRNIQTECTQLQSQIDAISQSTTFNGLRLFGNPHGVQPAIVNATFTTPATPTQFTPGFGPWIYAPGSFGSAYIANVAFCKTLFGIQAPPSGSSQVGEISVDGSISQLVAGFKAGVAYTLSFGFSAAKQNGTTPGTQEGLHVQIPGVPAQDFLPIPPDPAHPTWTQLTTSPFVPGAGTRLIQFQGFNIGRAFIDNVQINAVPSAAETAVLLNADHAYSVQDGANEGNLTSISTATIDTYNLGIAQNSVATSSNATTAETNVDGALDYVGSVRAILGARSVTLRYQADTNTTASLDLTASESNIRDAEIAQSTTALAKDQILSSVGQSILANLKVVATSVEKLFQ